MLHNVKETVAQNHKWESDVGVSMRSADFIDYTNFGELSVIIEHNWQNFADTYDNLKRAWPSAFGTYYAASTNCSLR